MNMNMKHLHTRLATAVIMFAAFNFHASAEKLRVLDKGIDGNQRNYTITCPDGTLSSVVQTFDIPSGRNKEAPPEPDVFASGGRTATTLRIKQVCIYPGKGKGEDICRSNWDLDTAAQASCQ